MRKFKKIKLTNPIARTGFHRIHVACFDKESTNNIWPLATEANQFYVQNHNTTQIKNVDGAVLLLNSFKNKMLDLEKLTCQACCGWGHISTDAPSDKSKLKRCIVNELIDHAHANATKKNEFNVALGKEKKPPRIPIGLVMSKDHLERSLKRRRANS